MYSRLADFPVLDRYPSRIPAAVWNVWRRIRIRKPRLMRHELDLPGLEPLQAILEERLWVCIDPTLADSPILAWIEFKDAGHADLAAAVPCTVLQYHFGASRYCEQILASIAGELERRLRG